MIPSRSGLTPNLGYICMVCNRKIEANSQTLPFTGDNKLLSQLPLVCGACKKFYWRNRKSDAKTLGKCTCDKSGGISNVDQPSSSSSPGFVGNVNNVLCRACRFSRCEVAILRQQSDFSISQVVSGNSGVNDANGGGGGTSSKRTNLQLVPCQVCGASSSGYHFGIISCEGCKGFFRRSLLKHPEYKCSLETPSEGEISKHHDRRRCKRCRYDACINAGMSNMAVRTGRHSMQRRIQTTLFVKQLAAENRLLVNRTFRRRRRKRCNSMDSGLPRISASATSQQTSPLPNDSKARLSSGSTSTFSGESPLEATAPKPEPQEQRKISSKIVKLSDYFATLSFVERDEAESFNHSGINWSEFRIGDEILNPASVAQIAVRALDHLTPLNELRGRPITPDMSPQTMWSTYMESCFQPHLNCILACARSMVGFSELAVPDRLKLFSYGYFPILMAQLSLGYDEATGRLNFLNLPDEDSIAALKMIFFESMDRCREQLIDIGRALKAWNPTTSEFAMLIALIFFNPSVPGLVDAEKVRTIKYVYEYVDSKINNVSSASISASMASSLDSGITSLVPPNRRFTCLVGYFQPMIRLLAQCLYNFQMFYPEILNSHPVFCELYNNMLPTLQ